MPTTIITKKKNPMTMTQWRRYQRYKKDTAENCVEFDDNVVDPKGKQKVAEIDKRPVKERLSLPHAEGNPTKDDEMDLDFMELEPDFDVICNAVSILPT